MRMFQYLMSVAALAVCANATPLTTRAFHTKWEEGVIYMIINVATDTALDLYNGDHEVYGWQRYVA